MSGEFLGHGTTYLPYGFSPSALERFGNGDPLGLITELGDATSYERVGVDRALAIAIDLALLDQPNDARILDVGCSVGTIGLLLSTIGYEVIGIDSDVVAGVQDWQDQRILSRAREVGTSTRFQFINKDLREFLATNDELFDHALLLSVVHHWLLGYGYTGAAQFDRDEMRETLFTLCARVRHSIYLETPIDDEFEEMPPDPEGEFTFPRWFLESGQATNVAMISSTIATNGKPRRLFRIDLV